MALITKFNCQNDVSGYKIMALEKQQPRKTIKLV